VLTVSEILDEAKEIFGHCNQKKLFRWISDSVELLANKGEIDPLVGYVDICVSGKCVTLPREVETLLAVNIGGRPSLGHDELFTFHLNGPGDIGGDCEYSWFNTGGFPTYRDLQCPSRLVAFLDSQEDEGKKLRVFGFDDQNRPLRTQVNGVWEDGLLVPTIYGYALPASTDPLVSRITAIVKDETTANVRLSSFENSTSSGTLLGIFEPDETKPRYRRIRITNGCDWVRIAYRKKTFEIRSVNDRILLHSRPALLLAMHAMQKYREKELGMAVEFEAQASRLLTERESVLTSPVGSPIQVDDRASLKLRGQDDID
jgi:hypothetical protein